MPSIHVTNYSQLTPEIEETDAKADAKKESAIKKPVEYIGVVVEPISPYVSGRVNLKCFLRDGGADKLSGVTATCESPEILLQILANVGLKKNYPNGAEIHIIECYQTVSSMFGIKEDQLPSGKQLFEYISKAVNTYTASSYGILEATPAPASRNGMFAAPTASATTQTSKPSEDKTDKKSLAM